MVCVQLEKQRLEANKSGWSGDSETEMTEMVFADSIL